MVFNNTIRKYGLWRIGNAFLFYSTKLHPIRLMLIRLFHLLKGICVRHEGLSSKYTRHLDSTLTPRPSLSRYSIRFMGYTCLDIYCIRAPLLQSQWEGVGWVEDEKNGQAEQPPPPLPSVPAPAPPPPPHGLGKISEQKGILGPGPAELRFSEAL
ncbi:hypothetical protein V6N11_000384 [Hibiscus sabdariffa]|uniref:Uncharacterized protein n=2 Tax=Hibiscus sabdariffa TaxID=183260 RepID=A0ABR2BSE9_9ROSI